jgi:hypothetical protein
MISCGLRRAIPFWTNEPDNDDKAQGVGEEYQA